MSSFKSRGHFIPHKRRPYRNELVNIYTGEVTNPESRTKQAFAAECDINNIIRQFKTTGIINHVSAHAALGRYEDLPSDLDLHAASGVVAAATAAFMTLPAKVRDRFGNDPSQFLAFMDDPANKDEAIKLGLIIPPPAPQPTPPPAPPPSGTPGGGNDPSPSSPNT